MQETISFVEFLFGLAGSLVAVIGAWIHMKVTVASLEQKLAFVQKELEEEKQSNRKNYEALTDKIDGLYEISTEIKVLIAKNTRG